MNLTRQFIILKKMFFASTYVLVLLAMIAMASVLYVYVFFKVNVFYQFSPELFLMLPPGKDTLANYNNSRMPKGVLQEKDRLFRVVIDGRGRRVVDDNVTDGLPFLLVGDSNLFGHDLSQGETIGDRLAQLYKASGTGVWISNYCIPGNTSKVALLQARALFPKEKSKILIVSVCSNDLTPSTSDVRNVYDSAIRMITREKRSGHWVLPVLTAKWFFLRASVFLHREKPQPMISLDDYKANLGSIAELARANDAAVVFLAFGGQYEREDDIRARYSNAIMGMPNQYPNAGAVQISAISKNAIETVRRSPHFEKERERIRKTYKPEFLWGNSDFWVTCDGGHPNPCLTEILAWEIAQELHRLKPDLLPPPSTPDWRTW